jgi:hypothetical protein
MLKWLPLFILTFLLLFLIFEMNEYLFGVINFINNQVVDDAIHQLCDKFEEIIIIINIFIFYPIFSTLYNSYETNDINFTFDE